METMIQYVIRKLNEPQINIPAVADKVGTSKQNLYNMIKVGDGKATLVQELNDYFKRLAD